MRKLLAIIFTCGIALFLLVSCKTSVISLSGSSSFAEDDDTVWLCTADEGIKAAKEAGIPVYERQCCTSGKDAWNLFLRQVDKKTPATIKLAYYYTLNKEQVSEELYNKEKDTYPRLYIAYLTYDGTQFSVKTRLSTEQEFEYSGPFKYLVHCTGTITTPGLNGKTYDKFFLSDDPDITWEQIQRSLFSSSISEHTIGANYSIVPVYTDILD